MLSLVVARPDWSPASLEKAGHLELSATEIRASIPPRTGLRVTDNGDAVDDLLIGAPEADPNDNFFSGASYVVFGGAGVGNGGHLELSALDGTNGFRLSGVAACDNSGSAVSMAGDVNGDGVDDLLIGAYRADPNGDGSGAGYVVFGGAGVGSSGNLEPRRHQRVQTLGRRGR